MPIPRGTRQLVTLREVAERLGTTPKTVKHWWWRNRLLGRTTHGESRRRVVVPIEVVEFYLRFHRLPTKLELHEAGVLSREYLRSLSGPDGGLSEQLDEGPVALAASASESGRLSFAPVS